MRCHYVYDKIAGNVLIPGCMAVAISNDKEDCTCSVNHKSTEERLSKLEGLVRELKKEIKILRSEKTERSEVNQ